MVPDRYRRAIAPHGSGSPSEMKITVLLHERDAHAESIRYVLWTMCDIWRKQGLEVEVVRGLGRPIHSDIVFLHIDLTVVPSEYLRALADHPCVINGNTTDISKTLFSRNQISSQTESDDPVIVKTVLNYGGLPEFRLEHSGWYTFLRKHLLRFGFPSLASADILDSSRYPVFESARHVSPGVFRNPALFVERFLPERCGDLYCVRNCTFFGDQYLNQLAKAMQPIVKVSNTIQWEDVPVPEAIHTIREQLDLDYGKLDYVMHNGETVLLDVSRTPAPPSTGAQHFKGNRLAAGIASFLPGNAASKK